MNRIRAHWNLIAAAFMLVLLVSGCDLPGVAAFGSTTTSTTVMPITSPMPDSFAPMASELEAAQAVEAQLIAVYESGRAAAQSATASPR
jgi:hypothetical protein